MGLNKKSLHVRISPIYHDILDQEIHREFIKGNNVKKNEMIEKAILCLAAEHEKVSKEGKKSDWFNIFFCSFSSFYRCFGDDLAIDVLYAGSLDFVENPWIRNYMMGVNEMKHEKFTTTCESLVKFTITSKVGISNNDWFRKERKKEIR